VTDVHSGVFAIRHYLSIPNNKIL